LDPKRENKEILDSVAHPIIYVRGYAMTAGQQNEAAADPFCGFNLGSTVYRASPDKKDPAKKFVFESPFVRLAAEYGYSDVYEEGLDIEDDGWTGPLPRKSIIIYRYYDEVSGLLGTGKTPSIPEFASRLSRLVLKVRDRVCDNEANKIARKDFRCYLVAHSMGGLICRAFLQNPVLGNQEARDCVDKVFTYATPHNGIDMLGLNVPRWLGLFEMNTFNVQNIAEYLGKSACYDENNETRVDGIRKSDLSRKFFCMIGTNRSDYETVMGLSRTFSGHGSDGLVRIENASLTVLDENGIPTGPFDKNNNPTTPCPTAYTYRSHSGYFGIVNSEEGYQNLTRFLFGNIRVDIFVDVDKVRLPQQIANESVNAIYMFELLVAPRGKRWYLSRRIAEEDSVACRSHERITTEPDKNAKHIYMSSVFLADFGKVDKDRPSLAYDLTLGVRVPEYETDGKFWNRGHFEGAYLYRDTAIVEITKPDQNAAQWKVDYGWQSETPGRAPKPLPTPPPAYGQFETAIPFFTKGDPGDPGITGQVRFVISPWNA